MYSTSKPDHYTKKLFTEELFYWEHAYCPYGWHAPEWWEGLQIPTFSTRSLRKMLISDWLLGAIVISNWLLDTIVFGNWSLDTMVISN